MGNVLFTDLLLQSQDGLGFESSHSDDDAVKTPLEDLNDDTIDNYADLDNGKHTVLYFLSLIICLAVGR